MFLLIRIAVAIVVAAWLMQQVRKPGGWVGRAVARAMGMSHSAMTDWGLQQLTADRRNVSRRTFGVVVHAGDGVATGGVPDRCRTSGSIESGGI